MKTEILSTKHPDAINRAAQLLKRGGIVAFPTDTVYGLAAAIDITEGIQTLYKAKQRDLSKAIPVLMSSASDLAKVSNNVSQVTRRLAEKYWPGPLTLIVPRQPFLPQILGPFPTVGVRVPDHPFALALMSVTGPLAVTSANLSGAANACTAQEVLEQLEGRVQLILDGGSTPGGKPSTVVDCTSTELRILRSGPISPHDLQKFFK